MAVVKGEVKTPENASEKAAKAAEYKVLANLKHGEKTYRKGHKVTLTAAEAAKLKPYNVVEPAK